MPSTHQLSTTDRTKMKAFAISALLGLAAAAPAQDSHQSHVGHGAVVSHGVAAHLPVAHAVHAAPLVHAGHAFSHPVAHHAVGHHATLVSHAVHHAAPVVHAAPAYAPAPIVHAAPAYAAPVVKVVKELPEPYTYTYGVADDYSKANFNAAETADANGVVGGSYSVSLPDGRIQTVTYTADHVNGYVAEVSYTADAVYPPAPAGGYAGEANA